MNDVQLKSNRISVEVESTEPFDSKKLLEGFPTSLYIDIRTSNTNRKCTATIKKIGFMDIIAKSSSELNKGEKIWFDICYDKMVLPVDAEIISKMRGSNSFTYGFELVFSSPVIKKRFVSHLQIMLNELEEALKELKK